MNRLLAFAFLLTFLSSCSSVSAVNQTPVIAGLTVTPLEVQQDTAANPTLAPFRLTLPTPDAEPVSGWRPPLYPLPWAISPYDHFYFARPIAADQVNWPLPDYRYGGIFFAPNIVHTGVDIPAPDGTPVMAAGPGTVVWTGWGLFSGSEGDQTDPYGLAVAIRHDFGFKDQQLYTVYAHLSAITVVRGQHLETGDLLGFVGATGATTGPHLHFEVRFPNNTFFHTFNPELWIAPPQGWGVLVGRLMDSKGVTLKQVEVTVTSETDHTIRIVKTYGGGGAINHDPYYNENLVLGDLPAGIYKISFRADDQNHQTWVEIFPGQVTYFTFESGIGFNIAPPPVPTLDFLPVTAGP